MIKRVEIEQHRVRADLVWSPNDRRQQEHHTYDIRHDLEDIVVSRADNAKQHGYPEDVCDNQK
jgi:hypothetical protein